MHPQNKNLSSIEVFFLISFILKVLTVIKFNSIIYDRNRQHTFDQTGALNWPESADIYVKFEGANLTGSMKDRMALSMIEGAERKGLLKPGMRVVEYTGGSTGSSLAMVCAKKGYQAQIFAR